MTIGIYAIYWEQENSKVYIGQSVNIEKRWLHHLWGLKNNKHINSKLQTAYNLYGKPKFQILEVSDINSLLIKEIFWVGEFNSIVYGYNIMHPEASKVGYLAANSKYSKLALLILFRLLRKKDLTYEEISDLTGINKSTVLQISRNEKHSWLHEKYPNISKKVEIARLFRLDNRRTNNTKVFTVKDILGNVYTFNNMYRFCKEHNLNVGNFHNMIHGIGNTCKGFSLRETAV